MSREEPNYIIYALSDDKEKYKGWNDWLENYFKNELQNKLQWIFIYSQNKNVKKSILLTYDRQIRGELEIDGYASYDHQIVSNYCVEREIDLSRRGTRPKGYLVKKIKIFKDKDELKYENFPEINWQQINWGAIDIEPHLEKIYRIVDKDFIYEVNKEEENRNQKIIGFVVKVGWSNNGWTGFDEELFKEESERPDHRYVKSLGFGHESWNFYEDFNKEWYYAQVQLHVTPKKPMYNGVVLFISKNPKNEKMFFTGIYGYAKFGIFRTDKSVIELLPENYKKNIDNMIKELETDEPKRALDLKNLKNGDPYISNFQGLKEFSTIFASEAYIEVFLEDFGILRFGSAPFFYISIEDKCKPFLALNLLEKAKESHIELMKNLKARSKKETIQTIINKIDLIINTHFRNYWQIAPGSRAELWDLAKETNIIGIRYKNISHRLRENLFKFKDIEEFKVAFEKLYEKSENKIDFEEIDSAYKRTPAAKAFTRFINEVKEGDIIVANQGQTLIKGIGIIKSKKIEYMEKCKFPIYRPVKWIKKDINVPIHDELKSKFGTTINPLTKEEFDKLGLSITLPANKKSEMSDLQKKINKILGYKKQLILYGPPGTGKTFIARTFSKFQNTNDKYILKKGIRIPNQKYFWWIINPINWSVVTDSITKNIPAKLTYKPRVKSARAFKEINKGDILFIYQTNPVMRICAIGQILKKIDADNCLLHIIGQIKGPSFSEMSAHPNIQNSSIIQQNAQGSFLKFEKTYVQSLLELFDFDKLKDFEIFIEYESVIELKQYITFHQSYSYEEFIEGLRPVLDNEEPGKIMFTIQEGTFKKACRDAYNMLMHHCKLNTHWQEDEDIPQLTEEKKILVLDALKSNNYPKLFLVIDEINRGDISRIFGELITLLEANKRLFSKEEIIEKLVYSKKTFGVPPNLYIIGTLNTADRSIALIDIALRRRFGFIEMMPDYQVLTDYLLSEKGLDKEVNILRELTIKTLKKINKRIIKNYDRDHQIGHSYFMSLSDVKKITQSKDLLNTIWITEIIPLLREYFYDNPKKLKKVLNKVNVDSIESMDILEFLKEIIEEKTEEPEEE